MILAMDVKFRNVLQANLPVAQLLAQLEELYEEVGLSNGIIACLRQDHDLLLNSGIDLNYTILRLPHIADGSIAGLANLERLFRHVDPFARVRLLEALLRSEESDLVYRLLETVRADKDDHDALYVMAAIIRCYISGDYEMGRRLSRRTKFFGRNVVLYELALVWTVFEFNDFPAGRALLASAGAAINPNFLSRVSDYIATKEAIGVSLGAPLFAGMSRLSLVELLEELRDGINLGLIPQLPRALFEEIDQIPDWHVKRAFYSFLKYCVQSGYCDDIDIFIKILTDLLMHRRHAAAVAFLMQVNAVSHVPLSFDNYKRLQMMILSTASRSQMLASVTRVEELFPNQITPEMQTDLTRLANLAKTASGRQQAPPETENSPLEIQPTHSRKGSANTRRRAEVAVCISGQLRSFNLNWSKILKHIVEPLEADVFLSTWDTSGFSVGYQNAAERILPPEITRILPPEIWSTTQLANSFPTLISTLERLSVPSFDILDPIEGITGFNIFKETKFDEYYTDRYIAKAGGQQNLHHFSQQHPAARPSVNQVKMFFTIWDSWELARKHSVERDQKYRIVIRLRPDMSVTGFSAQSVLDDVREDDVVHVNHFHPLGISDQFAFGGQRAMAAYMSAFPILHTAKSFQIFPLGYTHGGESLMFDNLAHAGIRVKLSDVVQYRLSSEVLPLRDFASLMLEDLQEYDSKLELLYNELQKIKTH